MPSLLGVPTQRMLNCSSLRAQCKCISEILNAKGRYGNMRFKRLPLTHRASRSIQRISSNKAALEKHFYSESRRNIVRSTRFARWTQPSLDIEQGRPQGSTLRVRGRSILPALRYAADPVSVKLKVREALASQSGASSRPCFLIYAFLS